MTEMSADNIAELARRFKKLQEKALQIQKPLIHVTVLPEQIQNYIALADAIKRYAEREMSVECVLSAGGDIQLVVCGDVHLDLCVEALRKEISFPFKTGEVHLALQETVVPKAVS